jgi:DNA polymerase-3 subunit delta'
MSKALVNRFSWPIVGHKNIVSYLQQSLENEKVGHAYLFAGPKQVGKNTVAQYFVNSLVCDGLTKGSGPVPCGQCECCRQIANKIHPDFFSDSREINEKTGKLKKNISIEQIRQLQNKLSLHSFLNSYKVAIIDQAEALSLEAANSLLKTLEEPTPKTVIILLVSNLALLPQTIASRCQVIKFLPVSTKDIFEHLHSLKVERKKAKALAELAFGRPGTAISYMAEPENYDDFLDKVSQFILLLKSSISQRFKLVSEMAELSDVNLLKESLVIWNKVLRDLFLIKYSAPNLVSNLKSLSELEKISAGYDLDKLIKILGEVNLAKRYLDANVNPRLTLENLVLTF